MLQSSLKEEDIFLLKKKIKGVNKGHSHSSTNTNKNLDNNKNNKMPMSTYMSYLSPGNNHIMKKKKKDNLGINKSLKHHLMLTSMNNSSIIFNIYLNEILYSIINIYKDNSFFKR